MFCPNCGKPVKDYDNFCRYCGVDLRVKNGEETVDNKEEMSSKKEPQTKDIQAEENTVEKVQSEAKAVSNPSDEGEEYVLYDIKKHWMALFWAIFLTPVFILYFWNIFLHTHSLISWVIVFAILIGIIYPTARYKSDRIIITNKFAHIKIGIIKPEEINVPIEDFEMFDVGQTFVGRMLGYGTVIFHANAQMYEYKYVMPTDYIRHIFSEPQKFIEENL